MNQYIKLFHRFRAGIIGVLSEEEGREFENYVLTEVRKAYPLQKNGEIIFRFPRLFFTAVK